MQRAVPRLGRQGAGWLLALGLVVTVACSAPAPRVVPGHVDPAGQPKVPNLASLDTTGGAGDDQPGVSLVSIFSKPLFVFGYAVPAASVQHASNALVGTVKPRMRLTINPLPGPEGTAAVRVMEESRTVDVWGAVTTPAQRQIYAQFADDPEFGDFLVVVTDVRVVDGPNPIPVTAYRWSRTDVEAYAACGIPAVGTGIPWTHIDPCTDEFFQASQTAMILPGVKVNGQ